MADVVEEAACADASGRTPGEQVREQEERPPTMADSRGQQALMVCLACPAAFSQMMPLAVHPRVKHSLALRLRTLCRRALRLGSALHRRLCWQLLGHHGNFEPGRNETLAIDNKEHDLRMPLREAL